MEAPAAVIGQQVETEDVVRHHLGCSAAPGSAVVNMDSCGLLEHDAEEEEEEEEEEAGQDHKEEEDEEEKEEQYNNSEETSKVLQNSNILEGSTPTTTIEIAAAAAKWTDRRSVHATHQESTPTHNSGSMDQKRHRTRSVSVTSSSTIRTSRILDIAQTVTIGSDRLRSASASANLSLVGTMTSHSQRKRRDVLTDEQLRSGEVRQLLTFEGDEALLRGSSLSTVLQNHGRIFENSRGSASTYKLSRVVAGIDSFVSHNWTVPRRTKYLALIYHYFFVRSLIGSAILLVILGVLYCSTDVLPVVIDKADNYKVGILARVLTAPCFALTLLVYSDVRAAICGGRGPTVFLDKTCIHQEDASMMQLGISKLGAFIRESKQMLTIFSDEYLRKLWTVYEVASFLTLHPTEDLKMLPTSVPRVVAISVASMYAMLLFGILIKMAFAGSMGQYIGTSIGAGALFLALRGISREKNSITETIAEFSVKKCTCFCEDDRPVIYKNIAVMMRKVLQLPEEMPEDDVLEQFDVLVRNELPQALTEQMGRYLIPMNKVFVMTLLFHCPFCMDVIASHVVDDRSFRDLMVRIFGSMTWGLADSPSLLLCAQWLTMRNLKCKTRLRERGWTAACVVLGLLLMWARALLNAQLLSMALKNNTGLILYVTYFVLSFVQVCWQGYDWKCCWFKTSTPDRPNSGQHAGQEENLQQAPESHQNLREVIVESSAQHDHDVGSQLKISALDIRYGDLISDTVLSAKL
mmetsp:Transcript_5449/g.11874  ORF Transcript_5449/g.11874 Transcript_5449/m.11874 type:complete len:748 (-) Transcript_5449:263-2506(-)